MEILVNADRWRNSPMSEARINDETVRATLSEHGDPDSFFVVCDCIASLDESGHPWALIIEQDDLAEAAITYLKKRGQVRDELPDVGEFGISD